MGWESYDASGPTSGDPRNAFVGGFVPDPWRGELAWQWQLTVIDGTIPQYKTAANIPPFDPSDPASWYLAESIPVPALVYKNGFPGRPIGVPQRMQVLPGDALHTHAVIPSNSTVCLWARWCNKIEISGEGVPFVGVNLFYRRTNESAVANHIYGNDFLSAESLIPVIGPSVGSLHGYTQPEASHSSNQNAVVGWGG
jgi:hypothetical protein